MSNLTEPEIDRVKNEGTSWCEERIAFIFSKLFFRYVTVENELDSHRDWVQLEQFCKEH
jgi:hypothetical protein